MVKFFDTPFGNYGYVLNGDFRAKNLPFSVTDIDRSKKVTRIRPSVYDARYLRTTNLSEGSLSMKVSDPQSYVKHGLLHDGQQLNDLRYVPYQLQGDRLPNIPSPRNSSCSAHVQSRSAESRVSPFDSTTPNVQNLSILKQNPKDVQFAGKPTAGSHHKKFAINYAASRSLASYLRSKSLKQTKDVDKDDGEDDDNDEKRKEKLISIDSSGKSLSNLNRLKTKRLSDIYTDLFEKMEQQRRSLIMKRVQTAEKIKNDRHHDEVEEQRKLLKSSIDAQRRQLLEVRRKHKKNYSERLNLLYTPKSSKVGYKFDRENSGSINPNSNFLSLSLPRETYGLPEPNAEKRPETVSAKHIYRFKPGKLQLLSYDQTRSTLPTKFNNVWTKLSPTIPLRKITTQAS